MRTLLIISTLLFAASFLSGQVSTTKAVKVGKTMSIVELQAIKTTSNVEKKRARKQQKQIPNFIGRGSGAPYIDNEASLPKGADPLYNPQPITRAVNSVIEPELVLEGLEFNPFVPDPCGEKNRDYYVQVVNASNMMVWDNDGIPLLEAPFAIGTLWESLNRQSGGDPIVLYDRQSQRWMITEFPPFPSPFVLIAISDDSNPLGNYTVYEYGTQGFPDYPKWSIWQDAVLVTTNEGGALPVYALNKDQLFSGADEVTVVRTTVPRVAENRLFQVLTPVDFNGRLDAPGTSLPMVMRMNDDEWGEVTEDRLELYSFDINWDQPLQSQLSVQELPVAPFDGDFCSLGSQATLNCVPQPSGVGLDGLPHVLMNQIHYRNFGSHESIVVSHSADATGDNLAGIRWYELRKNPTVTTWEVYQQGLHAPDDTLNRFMPAIAIDAQGNIGLAYSGSSSSVAPGLYVTGRLASDSLGQMTMRENRIFEGITSINTNGNRFGDYASMVVDAADGKTFWFTGEYGSDNNEYGTGIFSFQLTNDTTDLRVLGLAKELSNDSLGVEDLEFTLLNDASTTVNSYTYGYIYQGDTVTASGSEPIESGQSLVVRFDDAITTSDYQDYQVTLFAKAAGDQFLPNDSLEVTFRKIPSFDMAISSADNTSDAICGDIAEATVQIFNQGFRSIDSFTVDIAFSNDEVAEQTFFTTIQGGSSATVVVDASEAMPDGSSTAIATVTPLGMLLDQNPTDNSDTLTFERIITGEPTLVELDLDNFPQETTYELIDEDGTVLFTGGPLEGTELVRSFCLERGACYTFAIYDSFEDGIFDNPNLTITQTSIDSVVLFLQGLDFDDQFIAEFCLDSRCSAQLQTVIADASGPDTNDGTLIVNPGLEGQPFSVSIDGGNSFSSTNSFDSLAAGTYLVTVYDSLLMCSRSEEVVINSCSGQVQVDVENASAADANDGRITIVLPPALASGATYSLDGATPQNSPLFVDLLPGSYTVTVTFGNNCVETIENITITGPSSTSDPSISVRVAVSPNPTSGSSTVTVSGIDRGFALGYTLYDLAGNSVFASRLPKYDDQFVGELRIYHLPAGVYLMQFHHPDISRAIKVIKQ